MNTPKTFNGVEFPAGAIANAHICMERLETLYDFACQGGSLANCDDWIELRRCVEHLAEQINAAWPVEPGDPVMDDEFSDFVEQLTAWHTKKVGFLRDVENGIKEGTLLKQGDDPEGVPLTKEGAAFFKLGIHVALMELGTLPFTVTRNDRAEDEA